MVKSSLAIVVMMVLFPGCARTPGRDLVAEAPQSINWDQPGGYKNGPWQLGYSAKDKPRWLRWGHLTYKGFYLKNVIPKRPNRPFWQDPAKRAAVITDCRPCAYGSGGALRSRKDDFRVLARFRLRRRVHTRFGRNHRTGTRLRPSGFRCARYLTGIVPDSPALLLDKIVTR